MPVLFLLYIIIFLLFLLMRLFALLFIKIICIIYTYIYIYAVYLIISSTIINIIKSNYINNSRIVLLSYSSPKYSPHPAWPKYSPHSAWPSWQYCQQWWQQPPPNTNYPDSSWSSCWCLRTWAPSWTPHTETAIAPPASACSTGIFSFLGPVPLLSTVLISHSISICTAGLCPPAGNITVGMLWTSILSFESTCMMILLLPSCRCQKLSSFGCLRTVLFFNLAFGSAPDD